MNKSEFLKAKDFIFSDINREIKLAHASQNEDSKLLLKQAGVPLGGGNFLIALGLLCYTEFGGKLKYNRTRNNGSDHCSENFNLFLNDLGPKYTAFKATGVNVYDIFRCGLTHEYYVKSSCVIRIKDSGEEIGIGVDSTGKYWFVVEKYFKDLIEAFNNLEKHLYS